MNLFTMLYENPRARVDKDAPPKTGIALLFEIVRRDGWDICKISALCLIACLPIITIPAALSGFHGSLLRILRDKPGDPWSDFRKGWKENWKKSIPICLFFLFLTAFLRFAIHYYGSQANLSSFFSFVCGALMLFTAMAISYAFPMLTLVDIPTKAIIKNAFLLSLARPHHAIAGIAAAALMTFIAGLLPVVVLPLWVIFSFAVTCVIADWAAWHDIKSLIIR